MTRNPAFKLFRVFELSFLFAVAVNLGGILCKNSLVASCSKPFLMPLLAALSFCYLRAKNAQRNKGVVCMLIALLFHTLGDIFLIFNWGDFFLFGMLAFLIGHIFYFIAIFKAGSSKVNVVRAVAIGIFTIILAFEFLYIVDSFGIVGFFALPVKVYAMAFPALIGVSAYFSFKNKWLLLSMAGFVLFAVSDSMIALGTFAHLDFPLRGFWVMSSYVLAQAMIVSGLVKTFINSNTI